MTKYNEEEYWSREENHCSVPGCTSAGVLVPGPIPVTVVDSDETPQEGLTVYAYDGETYAGVSGTTDENGRVLLTLANGSYRFKTELNGVAFWSGESNHCTVFGCLGAVITVGKLLTVHVADTEEEPKAGLTVSIYNEEEYTGYSEATDENGDAVFTLPTRSQHIDELVF